MQIQSPRTAPPVHPEWNGTTRRRYGTMLQTLAPLAAHFRGQRVMDFGAGAGLSVVALLECGAREAVGVEIDDVHVAEGQPVMARYGERASLIHTRDTAALPFRDGEFEVVLCNAVLEHIPQPRGRYLLEMWRVLAPGGVLIVNETPNKYLPLDYHTTKLMWVPWLPSAVAKRYAELRGRWSDARYHPWHMSGWRGIGFFEMVAPLRGWELVPEQSSARHRLLGALGLPASLLDPYPCWVLRKRA